MDAESDAIFVARYRLKVVQEERETVRLHFSADERYEFRVDGHLVGRGPERSTVKRWCFETYDIPLDAGPHELVATVHSLGRHRPYAQESCRHALLVYAEGKAGPRFSTGQAAWTAEHVDAYRPLPTALPDAFVAVGARFEIDAACLRSPGPTVAVADAGPFALASMRMETPARWQLRPATLPPMLERVVSNGQVRLVKGEGTAETWQRFLDGVAPLTVPSGTSSRVVIDLDDYLCAYSTLDTSGGDGAVVSLRWAEALFEADAVAKAHRDRVDGLQFVGMGDTFLCDGGPTRFKPPWWLAGRYIELYVTTATTPLTLQRLTLNETRYPFAWDGQVATDDPVIESALPIARRAMEACAHETFYDCPYYEQLMYVGDTRLEALVTYAFSRDDRLPAKCVRLFDESRDSDSWTQARAPSRTTQVIPPFSWWWVGMVHDQMMWRDRPADLAAHLPGVLAVMEAAYRHVNRDGLYEPTTGWNFVDWADSWPGGVPVGGAQHPTAPLQFQLAHAARLAAEIAAALGEMLLARRHAAMNKRLCEAGWAAFYEERRELLADDLRRSHFSEQAQVLGVLAGGGTPTQVSALTRGLLDPSGLTRASVYFSHYTFEALRVLDRADAVVDRLQAWGDLAALGFKTTPEKFGRTRSDCHAWGAHPLFHLATTVLGVRPSAPHFAAVHIKPRLGRLGVAEASVVHPRGIVRVAARREGKGIRVTAHLPSGVGGVLESFDGRQTTLSPGRSFEGVWPA